MNRPARSPRAPSHKGNTMTPRDTLGFSLLEAAFCSRPSAQDPVSTDQFPILIKLAKAGALPDYPAAKPISPLLYAVQGTMDDWTRLQPDPRVESARLVDPSAWRATTPTSTPIDPGPT